MSSLAVRSGNSATTGKRIFSSSPSTSTAATATAATATGSNNGGGSAIKRANLLTNNKFLTASTSARESMQKIPNVTLERVEKWLSTQYWTDVNMNSVLIKHENKDPGYLNLRVYPVPDLARIPFEDLPDETEFVSCNVGDSFGPTWSTHWFVLYITIPYEWQGQTVELRWNSGCEAMVWSTDGHPLQGLTDQRNEFVITTDAVGDGKFSFYVEMACNGMFGAGKGDGINPPDQNKYFTLSECHLIVRDAEAYNLYYQLQIIYDMAKELKQGSSRQVNALYTANAMINAMTTYDKSTWAQAAAIGQEFLSAENGQSAYALSATGHCHIDSAWLWPYAETKRKCARSWSSQLRLIESYPNLIFSASQAQQFEWVEQDYPSLFQEIQAQVTAGRYLPLGATWVEMDCNIPSGESIVRQFLFGQNYYQSRFGERSRIFWLPDTFGYAYNLPQIILSAGCEYFLTQKLSWNLINKFPHNTFYWAGLNGDKILTHFPPADSYNSQVTVKENMYAEHNDKDKDRINQGLLLFGNGDGGGGPTRDMLERFSRLRNVDGLPILKAQGPVEFFDEVKANARDLLVWSGELYLELHRGTYTSQAKTKLLNRQCEWLLRKVEYLSVLARSKSTSFSYPKEELDRLWKLVMLNQFHDVIPGTSIQLVYQDAEQYYNDVIGSGTQLAENALNVLLNSYTDSSFHSNIGLTRRQPVTVVNTLSFSRTEVVNLDSSKKISRTNDNLVIVNNIPSMSLVSAEPEDNYTPVTVSDGANGSIIMENEFVSVEVSSAGHIISLIDKRVGDRELIPEGAYGNRYLIYEDIPLYWDAWDVPEYHLEKGFDLVTPGVVNVLETGPIRASVDVIQVISDTSVLTVNISLSAISPQLTFQCKVDWAENRKCLKVEFPLNIHSDFATYEIQYGTVKRPNHWNTSWDVAKYEVCAQRFADLSEYGYGVALLNNCKYGYGIHDNRIKLTLLRSPKNPDDACDIGEHLFSYALFPHEGDCHQGGVVEAGLAFNEPLILCPTNSAQETFFEVSSISGVNSMILDALKGAEANPDSDIVVRLYESRGGRGVARLSTSLPITAAYFTNVLEDLREAIPWQNGSCTFSFKPFQVITILLKK